MIEAFDCVIASQSTTEAFNCVIASQPATETFNCIIVFSLMTRVSDYTVASSFIA